MLYYKFSEYLTNKYGSKVYKLPVNLPVTCPNRDGKVGSGGCIFCAGEGAGFESLSCHLSVGEQLKKNSEYIGQKYKSSRFIAYFQNFSNTYLPLEAFKEYILEACSGSIAAIYISTRPDCINDSYLDFLSRTKKEKGIDILLELGLQTANYKTLELLNRGHSLAEFIDACIRIKRYGLEICAHVMVDLPFDTLGDIVETARIISVLGVDQVKCHSMYIVKGTVLGDLYEKGEVKPLELESYIDRIIAFLEQLNPEIAIQRLIGRAPEERTLFCNWGMSWWRIRDMVEEEMQKRGSFQGEQFNYTNGSRCLLKDS